MGRAPARLSIEGHKKGTYLLTYFKTEGGKLKDIVADCHLSDLILRELILKVHPEAGRASCQSGHDLDAQRRRRGCGPEDDLDERPRRRRRDD